MFIVCGEALFDVFIGAESGRSLHLDAHPGGSPFNVAIGLARLGQPVSFLGGLARDMLGDRLLDVLAAEGVGTATVQRFDAPTTLGMVEVGADGVPRYAFYGNGAADRLLTVEALPVLDEAVRESHLGSFATVVEPVASALEALVRRERERGATILFSTHVMAHAERLCDRIAIIARAQRRFEGSVDDARALLPMQVRYTPRVAAEASAIRALLPAAAEPHGEAWHFAIGDADVEPLLARITASGFGVTGLSISRPALHDAFVHIVRQVDAGFHADAEDAAIEEAAA